MGKRRRGEEYVVSARRVQEKKALIPTQKGREEMLLLSLFSILLSFCPSVLLAVAVPLFLPLSLSPS